MKKLDMQEIQKIHVRSFSKPDIETISKDIVNGIERCTYLFIDMSKYSQDDECIEIVGYYEELKTKDD